MSCLRMGTCCCCLDTAKGTVLIALACILACITTFVFIILGFVYWDAFSQAVQEFYQRAGFAADIIDIVLIVLWWGNIFTCIFMVIYVILCVMMIIGVKNEQFKHMIPWISLTFMLIPFVAFSFLCQLIVGIIDGGIFGVLIPAIVVLIWCCIWLYGFFCAVSHYRMLKGDIHRPVATLFKRDI